MLPWLPILRDALDLEYAAQPRIATLATVDAENRPKARTVILRRIDDDGALCIISSVHSDKNTHLRQNPFAELVLYLPKSRQQFRLFSHARVIGQGDNEPLRLHFWQAISDAARATFFWPTIGKPANHCDPVPASIPATTPIPDNFELINLRPDQVEHLTTGDLPHRRTRWRQSSAWQPEPINP